MPQMTPAQARVVDPVLTMVARGYSNAEFVGAALFPAVPVPKRGGKIIKFGKESFHIYVTARAPGTRVARIQYTYSDQSYSLEDHALEAQVPNENREEAGQVGVDLASVSVSGVMENFGLRLEKQQADLATDANNYASTNKATLSGTSQWSDHTNSDPITAVLTYKEAIRQQVGVYPDTLVMGAAVWAQLETHPVIIDRLKHTTSAVPDEQIMASLFKVQRVLVGKSVWVNESGVTSDVWGKDAVLAFTRIGGLQSPYMPSYGYTYRLRGYPVVAGGYYDAPYMSWIYPTADVVKPVLTGADAGFLIKSAVA